MPTPTSTDADQFIDAIRREHLAEARRLLADRPSLSKESIHAACGAADLDAVRAWLDRDPSLATATIGGDLLTPLALACASRMHEVSPEAAARSTAIVQLLLDRGVDPNSTIRSTGLEVIELPVLYLAASLNHIGATRLLLERGANPNDGESIYHAAQHGHTACLELLAMHGANLSDRHPQWQNTPLFFLAGHTNDEDGAAPWVTGMRWLLERGADPNVTSGKTRETPLHAIARIGRSPFVAAMLLGHGANPLAARADGRTPYALAVRSGSREMLDLLRAPIAELPDLPAVDRLIGACMQADSTTAHEMVSKDPEVMRHLTSDDQSALHQAASLGRVDAVALMLSLGFDAAFEDPHGGGTPLHHAAWWGRPAVVAALLAHGAPLNFRDSTYGSSPVAWAAHGSVNCRTADDDYCAVVEMLLDAGSLYETSINKWNEPPTNMGSARVSAIFARRGFGPAPPSA